MSTHVSILDGPAEPRAMQMEEFCQACQTTHSLQRGCQCARCGCGLHPLFICCVSGINGENLAWCPTCDEMRYRALSPRAGDRILFDEKMTIEVLATHTLDLLKIEAVSYLDHRDDTERLVTLALYQERAETAIKGGHTFHAVEDDEE